ncbi:MAG: 50S ribosomal protein L23 [Deltaproteobacteria bacterium]|nr:50S ribosomal protein L23 [Deltaproteobacteria bacterium]
MNPYSVIIRAVLSEKSDELRMGQGKYTFQVRQEATKTDIKSAVEQIFDVKVKSVATCITRGKYRRRGAHSSLGQKKKKAVVALQPGQKLTIFDD